MSVHRLHRAASDEAQPFSARAEQEFSEQCPAREPCTSVGPQRRKRLARARIETAEIVDELLEEHWQRDDSFSNRAIAERLLDVEEKTVRQWRKGDKPMPIAALLCLPLPFAEDLAERLLEMRRELAGDRRSIVALGRAVERCNQFAINGVMSESDREAFVSAVRRFIEQLEEIAAAVESST